MKERASTRGPSNPMKGATLDSKKEQRQGENQPTAGPKDNGSVGGDKVVRGGGDGQDRMSRGEAEAKPASPGGWPAKRMTKWEGTKMRQ